MTALIPLYAIGVFLSFTLSQTGMARRWWKIGPPGARARRSRSAARALRYEPGWPHKMVDQRLRRRLHRGGAWSSSPSPSSSDGAWIVMILIPALVTVFFASTTTTRTWPQRLSLEDYGGPAARRRATG